MNSVPTGRSRLLDILTDPETSLLSEGYFGLRLEEEFKKSWRYGWPYALLVVRVAGLDALAEARGDTARRTALLHLCSEILGASRDIDLSARLGPDRFAVLLPGTDAQGARAFADRVFDRMLDGRSDRLSIHAGGATAPQDDLASPDELLARAERALEASCEAGDGRFVLWNQPSV